VSALGKKIGVDCSVVPPPPQGVAFSNALLIGDRLVVSGMHASDGQGSCLEQAREALDRIKALVEAAGGSIDDVVSIRAYVTSVEDKVAVNRAKTEYFTAPYPCSTLVEVNRLVLPGLVVELEAEAIVGLTRGHHSVGIARGETEE
jgi:2-iminobutanoate/2-iminopropanoate deaminase